MHRPATGSRLARGSRFAAGTFKILAVALAISLPAVAQSVEVDVTGPAGVAGGSSFDYTITVTNPDAAVADVSVIDTLPAELSYASSSGASWSCSASGTPQVVTCGYSGSLPTGTSSLTLSVDAAPQAADILVTNSVAVEVSGTEDDTASVDTTVYADDLTVVKQIDDAGSLVSTLEVIGGGDVTFEITVTNDAPVAAANVQVRDFMPANFEIEANPLAGFGTDWACTIPNGAPNEASCDYEGSPLAAGATTPALILTATVPVVESSFTNMAEAQSDGSVSAYPHDSASVTVDVYLESDLRVSKSAGASTVYSGDSLTYTYTLSNLGPHEATGIKLVDVFDRDNAVASFSVAPAADWTCQEVTPAVSGETAIECLLDASETLLPDASTRQVSLTVTPATVDVATTLTNQATITSDQRLPAVPQNVSAQVAVDLVPSADVSLDRTSVPATPVEAESAFSWQLQVNNAGPSLADDLVVLDGLPEGVVVTGFSGGWNCSANQRLGQIRCELGQLAASGQSTITVNARAPRNPSTPGQATALSSFGSASVGAVTHDPNPGNNGGGSDSFTVAAVWDLALLKDSASTLLVPEQAFTYEISISNGGPSDLVGGLRPLLDDVFDARLRGVFGTCDTAASTPCWSCSWLQQPSWDQTVDNSVSATTGLGGAWPVAISPDGANLYVGGRFDDAIGVLDRDTVRGAAFGQLSLDGINEALAAPRALAVHPSGEWLVAVGFGAAAELKLFSRDVSTGVLAEVQTFGQTFNQAADLVFSANGENLYIAESGADRIRHLSFDAATALLAAVANTNRDAAGGNPVLLDGVSGLGLAPEGAALYAAAPGDNAVVAFSVDAASGALSPISTASSVMDNGSGPVPVSTVVAGTGEVFAGGGDSLFIIQRAGLTEPLGTSTSIVASDVPAKLLNGISDLALSGDQNRLFVSAADDAAVSLIERDGASMVFRRSVALPDALEANGLVLDGGDERLYVTATSGPVDGSTAPDTGAVLVYRTLAAGGCDALRRNEISNDPVDDVAVTLPAGQQVVMTIHAAVKAGTPTGNLSNTADLEAALDWDDAANELLSSTKTLPIRNATEVIATTDAPGQRPIPGSDFAFTVNIVNNGPSGVTGLEVTDLLPLYPADTAGFVSGSTNWQCSASENACCNPGQSQCGVLQPTSPISGGLNGHVVNIGAQASLTFTLAGRLHPGADPEGTITNEVQLVMPDGIEAFSSADLFDSHSEALEAEADVWVDKRSPGPVEVGGNLFVDYEVEIGNFGPSAVRGINLRDLLDDPSLDGAAAVWSCSIVDGGESTLVNSCCDYDIGAGACQATNLSGQSGTVDQDLALAPDARALFTLRVPVSDAQAAQVENTATGSMPATVTDTDPANNADSQITRLQATANLEITKQILAGSSVTPGEQVQFLITVTNADGPDGVPVTVNDLFDSSLTDVTWSCDATTPIPGDLSYAFDLGLGENLPDASAVASSDDGRHVYALGAGVAGDEETTLPATLAVFERNIVPGPSFGSLVQLELEIEGVDDASDSGLAVEGLTGGRDMVLSPDQRHLYIASSDANAVTVFQRAHVAGSEDFGRLTFVESRALGSEEPADAETPVTGLRGASDVAVSADGDHVYVVGKQDHAVAIFRRNPSTGTLAFEGQVSAFELGLADALWGATSIDIAPNDRDVYVTGSGLEAGFSGPDWSSVEYAPVTYGQSYFVNNTAGVDVKWLSQEQSITLPAFDELYFEFEHRFNLDASYGCFDVGVLQYSKDGGETWSGLDVVPSPFEDGGYNGVQNGYEGNPLDQVAGWCSVSPGFASGFDNVRVSLTGLASPGEGLKLRFGLGEGSAIGGDGWWIDNLRLYSVSGGTETTIFQDQVQASTSVGNVVHFQRQSEETTVGFGTLAAQSVTVVESDPASLLEPAADFGVMDSNGQNLYVGDSEGMIVVYQRDSSTGNLTRLQVLSFAEDPVPGIDVTAMDGLSSLAVSADGEHVIATGRAVDRLVVLRRLPFVGTLAGEQMLEPGAADIGRAPGGVVDVRDAVFSSDGRHVFTVTGQGQLGVFDRQAPDPTYGFLEAVFDGEDDGFGSTATGLLGARAVTLSSDGRWVYAAGFGQVGSGERGSMTVLERDSGATEPGRHLRFERAFRDLQGGVEGLDGATDLVALLSGDGLFQDIYVVSERDSAVTHFRQDLATGTAVFVGVYRDGNGGVTGLAGGSAITASPGGNFVFAAGRFDHAVNVFDRNPADGSLTPIGEARDGVDGVIGMLGASGLAMSRDGAHLYVAARQSDSVVVLEHDAGMLSYRQTFYDGTDGAIVTSPTGIDVTYDSGGGEHVIVTSLDGDAVTVLARESDPSAEALYGRLRFQQVLSNAVPGLEAMISPRGVRVDPSNDRVYVAADGGNALIVLDRNTSVGGSQFGDLYALEVRQNNTAGIIGLDRPYGLAVSRGSRRNIYTAALGSQSVAAFVRRAGSSCAAAGGGDLSEEVFIAADGTIRFTVTATVDPGETDPLNNEATLTVGSDVTNTGPNTSDQSQETPLTPRSELTVSKDNARLSVVAGETDNYRIVIGNDGPSHARNVLVSDLLSGNDQFDETTAIWSCRAIGAGDLRRQFSLIAGSGDSEGLAGASSVAWAPAPSAAPELGERVYVTGLAGNALTVLSIDPVTGDFVIEDQVVEGGNDVDGVVVSGLRGARDVVVSADGDFIYVSSQVDDALLVFEPELSDPLAPEFGRLRLVNVLSPADPGLEALDQPQGMALSGDGTSLYLAAANSGAVFVFQRDPATGGLTLQQLLDTADHPELSGATQAVMGPEGDHVYVAGTGASSILVFNREIDGTLAANPQIRQAPAIEGLSGVVDLALSPDGDHLYAVGRDANAVVVFARDNEPTSSQYGRLGATVQQLDGEPGLLGPRAILVSDDGGSVYVAAFETSSVLVYRRDRVTGEIQNVGRRVDGTDQAGLSGVSSLAFSGDGESLFTGAVLDGAVVRFDRAGFSNCAVDSGTGDISLAVDVAAGGEIVIDLAVDVVSDAEGVACPAPLDPERRCVVNTVDVNWNEPNGAGARSVSSADASFLDAAARLTIDKTDGLAEFRGLAGASAVAGTEVLGSHLYVAAPGEPGMGVYALAPSTGPAGDSPMSFEQLVLNGEGSVSGLNGISDILVSPDGRHVYAASSLDSAVVVFEREETTGRLDWLATYSNNSSGIIGLAGARSLSMDSLGRHLYVVGTNANAVVVFDRQQNAEEALYGSLSFNGLVQNGTGNVIDMERPVHLTLSPDDRHLYVAAAQSDAVVVFARNTDSMSASFGQLQWRQSRRNLIGPVSGLLDVSQVLVSPDGATLYAAGTGNNAIVRFSRNTSAADTDFGRLAFESVLVDGQDGVEGLLGVGALQFMGGSAEWLIAASRLNDSLAVFERDGLDGSLQFVESQSGSTELDGAADLWTDSSGSRLHLAASESDAVSVFDLVGTSLVLDGAMVQGGGGAVPGGDVEYLITVHNEGPSRVENARVTDFFPDLFDAVSWSCQIVGPVGTGSSCPNAPPGGFSGNVDVLISLAAGDSAVIAAVGTLRPDATGSITNTARVDLPAGIFDLSGGVNEATDDDTTINSRSDLRVAFENPPSQVAAGAPFDLRVTVHNDGPGALSGSSVALRLPEAVLLDDWICQPNIEPGLLELAGQSTSGFALGRAAALSHDGRHVYVAGEEAGEDVLVVYTRDPLTGNINLRQQLFNLSPDSTESGAPIVDGLAGGLEVLVSPDDLHVYVAGRNDDAVAQFARDDVTGDLSFIGLVRDGVGSVDGLAGVRSLVMNTDGTQLYAAGELDDAVAVFARDPSTGQLSFQQVRRNQQDGVDRLDAPFDLVLLDDGAQLWVAARDADAIVRFAVGGNGLLTADGFFQEGGSNGDGQSVNGLDGLRSLALRDDGVLVALARTASAHSLTLFERPQADVIDMLDQIVDGDQIGTPLATVSGLAGGDGLVIDPIRDVIYVAARDSGSGLRTVSAFVEDADAGGMQYLGTFSGGSSSSDAAQAVLGADGRQLYLLGGASIDRFRVLAGSACERKGSSQLVDIVDLIAGGQVTYDLQARVMPNARGAFDLQAAVAPLLADVDPEPANNSAVTTVSISAESALAVEKTTLTDPVVAGEDVTWQIRVSNDGPSSIPGISVSDFLPVLPGNVPNPGAPGVIAGSAQWQCTGLDPLAVGDIRPEGPMSDLRALAVSEDGTWALAAGPDSATLWLYARDPSTGALSLADSLADGDEILGENDEVIATVAGLSGAADATFSRDARDIYVVSQSGDSVARFTLDSGTGTLGYGGIRSNAESNIIGLDGPVRVIVGAADDRLYIGARDSSAVTVFGRDPLDGSLQWRQSLRSGIGLPLNVLDGVRDLVISPDSAHLYAAAAEFDAVVTFTIDGDGNLAYSEYLANGDAQGAVTVVGLGLVQSLAFSPQGRHLYAASLADDSVTLLSRDPASGSLTWQWQLRNGLEVASGLDGASALHMSEDGQYLYAGARNDGGVVVFEREWTDGSLTDINRLYEPSLDGVRRLIGDNGGLIVAVEQPGSELISLDHQPAGFCGQEAETAIDEMVDSISLAPGAEVEYHITARVHPGARGVLANSAEALLPLDVVALTPAEHVSTAESPIGVVTGLDVVKSISSETTALVAGGSVGFLIDVANAGPSHGFGVTVSDLLPGILSQVTWSCETIPALSAGSSCPASGTGDILEAVDLLEGERLLFQVEGVIDPFFLGQLSNTATVAAPADGSDPDLDDNESTVSGTVNAVSDIQVTKTASVSEVAPDVTFSYEIVVFNAGPSDAGSVSVEDLPPAALSFESWTCAATGGSCAASGSGPITETIAIDAGGQVIFTVTARVAAGTPVGSVIVNEASASLGGAGSDPAPGNDLGSASVTVIQPQADVEVIKTVDAASGLPGDVLTYQIVVSNAGPQAADLVEITDTMPAGLLSASWTCQGQNGTTCPSGSGSGDLSMQAAIPVGGSLVFVVTGQIDPALPASPDTRIINTASAQLAGQAIDPVGANNSDTAQTVLDLDVLFRDTFELLPTAQETE